MQAFENYLYPDMTQEQIDFFTEHVKQQPSVKFNEWQRHALMHYRMWNLFLMGRVDKETSTRFIVRYLHHTSTR